MRKDMPTIVDLQLLCQRVRLAGAPGGKARAGLLAEYRKLAAGLGIEPLEVTTGADLQRASVELLKQVSGAKRALRDSAEASPGLPARRVGSW